MRIVLPICLALILVVGSGHAVRSEIQSNGNLTTPPGRLESLNEGLAAHHIEANEPALLEALRNADSNVRVLAAAKLAEDKTREAIPAIRQALSVERIPMTRINLASALAMLGDRDGVITLQETCSNLDSPPYIATTAASYLNRIGSSVNDRCRDRLISIIESTNDPGSLQNATSLLTKARLSKVESARISKGLVRALRGRPAMRMAAGDSLADFGETSALPALEATAGQEKDPTIRARLNMDVKRLERTSEKKEQH